MFLLGHLCAEINTSIHRKNAVNNLNIKSYRFSHKFYRISSKNYLLSIKSY